MLIQVSNPLRHSSVHNTVIFTDTYLRFVAKDDFPHFTTSFLYTIICASFIYSFDCIFFCTHLYSGNFLSVDVHLIVFLETDVCLLSFKRAVMSPNGARRSLITIVGAFDIPDPQWYDIKIILGRFLAMLWNIWRTLYTKARYLLIRLTISDTFSLQR